MNLSQVERCLARKDVAGLCRLLYHRNSLIRRHAVRALGELGQSTAVPHLAQLLRRESDQYVLRWAVDSLQKIGGQTAVNTLAELAFSSRREVAGLATQALAALPAPEAASLLALRGILLRNDWEALDSLGEESRQALSIVLRSDQYKAWPAAKRRRVLATGVRLGVDVPPSHSRELAGMGLFVSGIHTVGDLLWGLRHHNPTVRVSAAEKLGASGQKWTAGFLYRRFLREQRSGGERRVLIAIARALSQLGDDRIIARYKEQLYRSEGRTFAEETARVLVEIGTPQALEAVFQFVVSSPAHHHVSAALAALEDAGPLIVEVLRPFAEHEDANVRRLVIEVLARSRHPEGINLLSKLGGDENPDVQRAALEGLAALNSEAAVEALSELADHAPREWVVRALAAITHPAGPRLLQTLVPDVTISQGTLLDNGQAVAGAYVQVVCEHFFGEKIGWDWRAISARAETDDHGNFTLAVLDKPETSLRLKVTIPPRPGKDSEVFMADLVLQWGQENLIRASIDRFLARLIITQP
jgi:HEAT repeat protein